MPQISTFFLAFAAAFALAARLLPRRWWPLGRDLVGLGFLGWWDARAAGCVVVVGCALWVAGRRVGRWRFWGLLSLMAAVYVGVRIAQRGGSAAALLAPAGFGFLMLRLVHYWVERARGDLPEHGPRDVVAWLLYFPTVLVGPVQRFDDWLRWERRRRWDATDAARGFWRVLLGYFTVVVLSFWLVGDVLPLYALAVPDAVAWTLMSTATLYLSFSGLSSIAVGLGHLGGQRLPENFDQPFLQHSLPAFWRSWHMTVSEWCRTYVYLPVLTRTRSVWGAAGAAMAVFALWHELSLGMLAWGAWQGLGLALWHRLLPREIPRRWRPLSWLATMSWVLFGFWLLRAWPRGGAWYAR